MASSWWDVKEDVQVPIEPANNINVAKTENANGSQVGSWGVELEFVLAFHEDSLNEVLNEYPDATRPRVVPDDKVQHDIITGSFMYSEMVDHGRFPPWRWPSNILEVPENDATAQGRGIQWDTWTGYRSRGDDTVAVHRTYAIEPLLIAQKALHEANMPVEVVGSTTAPLAPHTPGESWDPEDLEKGIDYQGNTTPSSFFDDAKHAWLYRPKHLLDYTDWLLVRDVSVWPSAKSELSSTLGLSSVDVQRWDSDGIELVSKKYDKQQLEEGCNDIGKIFSILSPKAGSQIRMMESVYAGTHVHVGLSWQRKSDIGLYLLRHLAFIILGHEELISKLHDYRRRDVEKQISPIRPEFVIANSTSDGQSFVHPKNRTPDQRKIIAVEAGFLEHKQKYVSCNTLHSNLDAFKARRNIRKDQDIRRKLADFFFDPSLQSNDLFLHLQKLDKYRQPDHHCIVDFHHLADLHGYTYGENREKSATPKAKPTIEFRQHGCTLDADEVKHWVKFLFALIAYAERRAAQTVDHNGRPLASLHSLGQPGSKDFAKKVVDREMSKYRSWPRTIKELCGSKHLALPEEEVEYWHNRVTRYETGKSLFLRTKKERRTARNIRKLKNGKILKEEDLEYLPLRRTRTQLTKWNENELRGHIKGYLHIDETTDDGRRMWNRVQAFEHKQLVDVVVSMERNLRDKKIRCYVREDHFLPCNGVGKHVDASKCKVCF